MMEKPFVSIVIPVYNGANYMREAIDSALAQTYQNIEVIVVNDGSNDNGHTDAIARSYGERIRYFVKPNGGVSSALNFGIQMMRGEYFSWLSHDDIYESEKIEKQVDVIRTTDRRTLVCCGYSCIDKNSNDMVVGLLRNQFETGLYAGKMALEKMLKRASINGCCLLIPKYAFKECGGFDESLCFCQDVFAWYKIFLAGYSMIYIPDRLVKSRIHDGQVTQTSQSLFYKECADISGYLTEAFAKASDDDYKLLRMYLCADAKYLPLSAVRHIICVGKNNHLISLGTELQAYVVYGYGRIRPLIRKIYYRLFQRINVA